MNDPINEATGLCTLDCSISHPCAGCRKQARRLKISTDELAHMPAGKITIRAMAIGLIPILTNEEIAQVEPAEFRPHLTSERNAALRLKATLS